MWLPPACGRDARLTWLLLARSGKVGDAGVRAHQHTARVQRPLQKALLGFGDVNPAEGSLGQAVGGNQGQAVHAHLVDAVDGLGEDTGQQGLRLRPAGRRRHGSTR